MVKKKKRLRSTGHWILHFPECNWIALLMRSSLNQYPFLSNCVPQFSHAGFSVENCKSIWQPVAIPPSGCTVGVPEHPRVWHQKAVEDGHTIAGPTNIPPSCCPKDYQSHDNLCRCHWHVINPNCSAVFWCKGVNIVYFLQMVCKSQQPAPELIQGIMSPSFPVG